MEVLVHSLVHTVLRNMALCISIKDAVLSVSSFYLSKGMHGIICG